MSFLHPWMLLGALGALIPLLVHLFDRRRPRPVPFPPISRLTRPKEPGAVDFVRNNVSWGAGPRASQYLVVAAKARAILHGRFVASVDDVKSLAKPVLRHRVLPNFHAEAEGITSVKIIEQLLSKVEA